MDLDPLFWYTIAQIVEITGIPEHDLMRAEKRGLLVISQQIDNSTLFIIGADFIEHRNRCRDHRRRRRQAAPAGAPKRSETPRRRRKRDLSSFNPVAASRAGAAP